ncbi:sulfur carrier protein ThiS [Lutispora saccharofermentans]|mgnify:FL=1|uniref:Sulfur carrier protein ThiS n=1 Tax=Lutispora saccharofermentans TaxID=3024236 RepID=A0ABT1NDE1_9FIRM|nr:sulfur carrier protein ThiS [Lutispora saccharofermentans]MCQ1529275.1 sulfur carrier protein ThiS [Lutispora saccharofermentans]
MIRVNGKEFPWEEGMTVRKLLELKKYAYPRIMIKINGQFVRDENFDTTVIHDGDDVQCIHLMAGG